MKIRLFYHSLLSDWNHGNAHFLRGIVAELRKRGHDVRVYEEENNWSLMNLRVDHGDAAVRRLRRVYPGLSSVYYDLDTFDVEMALSDADLVLVHEWSDRKLVQRIGEARRQREFVLFFHDTHHRMVTAPEEIRGYDLSHYDGVLAYGQTLRERYLAAGVSENVWVWHEAADTAVFYPRESRTKAGDLVWIGNWGDGERTEELQEFLIDPVKALGLKARVYGVRYPDTAKRALAAAGIEYAGWLPNFDAPDVFAQHRVTVHVPRRPYTRALPGIPTIRPFEAMACGIPLISAPWNDAENLFTVGKDFLVARDGAEMRTHLTKILSDEPFRRAQIEHGLDTIRRRHTCAHRTDELLDIAQTVRAGRAFQARAEKTSLSI